MSALRSVWDSAWAELPDSVHEAFSQQRRVKSAVVKGMFPTAFADLEPGLRTYRWFTRNPPVSGEDEDLIRTTLVKSTPTLLAAAHNYLALVEVLDGGDLGMDNPVETLSAFAWRLGDEHGALGEADVRGHLEDEYPPAATLKELHRALKDPALVERVDGLLVSVTPCEVETSEEGAAEVDRLVALILDSPVLAKVEKSTAAVDLDPGTTQAWAELLTHPHLAAVHGAAVGLGLAHRVPVARAGLMTPAETPTQRIVGRQGPVDVPEPPRALEQSIVGRLRRPLDVDRELLVGLRVEQVLADEVRRSVSPLGLAAAGAHALFAVVRGLSMEVGQARLSVKAATGLAAQALPRTALGRSFVGSVRRTEAAKGITRGYARITHEVISTLDDPTLRYTTELWGRAHGHDVRSSLDMTDLPNVFTQLYLGVRETVFRRLDELQGGVQLGSDGNLPDKDARDDVEEMVAGFAVPTRADALPAFLAVLAALAKTSEVDYAEVRRFVATADADEEPDEEGRTASGRTWDRWRTLCAAPEWLTLDVVVAVLPLMRREPDGNPAEG